jgi:uncharacterized protein (DUF39 family)
VFQRRPAQRRPHESTDEDVGATALPEDDPCNRVFPGQFQYGGAHVIEDLVSGKDVSFRATAYGTDCYPRTSLETMLNMKDLNTAMLMNPRNSYQNYNVAVNVSGTRPLYTYMGILLPKMANANFCSAGQLSPLLKDPNYRTIGIGTRIFIGGSAGYVFYQGTQHNPGVARGDNGIPRGGAGTLAVIGDMKRMSPNFLRAVSITGYGVSLSVGIGIPIPILDEDMARCTAVKDSEIFAPVVDYSEDYPQLKGKPLGHVSYAELRSGTITAGGKRIRTAALSSYPKAVEIAGMLKDWISRGEFLLGRPVDTIPGAESGIVFKPLNMRPPKKPPVGGR